MWSDRTKNVLGEKELEIKKSVDTNNNTIMYTVTIMTQTFIEPYKIHISSYIIFYLPSDF